jgi:hypothetical protein
MFPRGLNGCPRRCGRAAGSSRQTAFLRVLIDCVREVPRPACIAGNPFGANGFSSARKGCIEAALHSVDEAITDVHPYTVRQVLAQYIIHQALRGQRDPNRVREGALAYLAENRAAPFTVAAR